MDFRLQPSISMTDQPNPTTPDQTIPTMSDQPNHTTTDAPSATTPDDPNQRSDRAPARSIMLQQFLSGKGAWEPPADVVYWEDKFPKPYFFYGSLMDPTRLSSVLHLKSKPSLQAASIIGYRLMLWGPYPALVDAAGQEGAIVRGFIYQVQNQKDAERLQLYETSNYEPHRCRIYLDDGTWQTGNTFMWRGAESTTHPVFLV